MTLSDDKSTDRLLSFAANEITEAEQTGLPTKVIMIFEYVDIDGEQYMMSVDTDIPFWDKIGMLAFEQAALTNHITSGLPED